MNISEIERKLTELDRNLHSILEMVREAKEPEQDVVESVAGAWGYDVDSVEFVRELRRIENIKAITPE
jgi:molecular chaperone GrpE (heat shock protein)